MIPMECILIGYIYDEICASVLSITSLIGFLNINRFTYIKRSI